MKALRGLVPGKRELQTLSAVALSWTSLRWMALPVTDRRWTAPLSAAALGMGLFVGVAIGPGTDGTFGAAATPTLAAAPLQSPDKTDALEAPALGGPVASTDPGPSAPPPVPAPSPVASTPTPIATAPIAPAPTPVAPVGETTTTAVDDTETTDETTPTPTEETTPPLELAGTVIHVNSLAGSYALVTGKGQINAVHSKKLPKPGTKLTVAARELANGTFAVDGAAKKSGQKTSVKVGGLVTWSDEAARRFTLSRKGVSVAVTLAPEVTEPAPAVGALVTVTATIGPPPADPLTAPAPAAPEAAPPAETTTPATTPPVGRVAPGVPEGCGVAPAQPAPPKSSLTATAVSVDTEFLGYGDFEGIVQGVCPDTAELILSADDQRAAGADLTIKVADPAISLTALAPGDVVDATVLIDEQTKALELSGIAADGGLGEADDADLAQGDQVG